MKQIIYKNRSLLYGNKYRLIEPVILKYVIAITDVFVLILFGYVRTQIITYNGNAVKNLSIKKNYYDGTNTYFN